MTIRIDTARNRINATVAALQAALNNLEDLHTLAYERRRANLTIRGTTVDWALDNHGDPAARHAYRLLANTAIGACEALTIATNEAQRVFNQGERQPRTRPAATPTEIADAIQAQARRQARGEYTPVRLQPQPLPHH
jgi:hypothetical protein